MTPLILALSKMLMSGVKRGGGGGGSRAKSTGESSDAYHRKELLKGGTGAADAFEARQKVISEMMKTEVQDPADIYRSMKAGKYSL